MEEDSPFSYKDQQLRACIEYGQQLVERINETNTRNEELVKELNSVRADYQTVQNELRSARMKIQSLQATMAYLESACHERDELRQRLEGLWPAVLARDDAEWLKRVAATTLGDIQEKYSYYYALVSELLVDRESEVRRIMEWTESSEMELILECHSKVTLFLKNPKKRTVVCATAVPVQRQIVPLAPTNPIQVFESIRMPSVSSGRSSVGSCTDTLDTEHARSQQIRIDQLECERDRITNQLHQAYQVITNMKTEKMKGTSSLSDLPVLQGDDRVPVVKRLASLYVDVQWAATTAKVWQADSGYVVTRREASVLYNVLGQLVKNFQWLMRAFLTSDELRAMGMSANQKAAVGENQAGGPGRPMSQNGFVGFEEHGVPQEKQTVAPPTTVQSNKLRRSKSMTSFRGLKSCN